VPHPPRAAGHEEAIAAKRRQHDPEDRLRLPCRDGTKRYAVDGVPEGERFALKTSTWAESAPHASRNDDALPLVKLLVRLTLDPHGRILEPLRPERPPRVEPLERSKRREPAGWRLTSSLIAVTGLGSSRQKVREAFLSVKTRHQSVVMVAAPRVRLPQIVPVQEALLVDPSAVDTRMVN